MCLERSRAGASSGIKLLPGKTQLADAKVIIASLGVFVCFCGGLGGVSIKIMDRTPCLSFLIWGR